MTEFQNTGQVRDRNADLDLGWFRPRDVARVQAGVDTAVELAERSECDTALSAYGIESLRSLVSQYRVNGNIFDGRSSTLSIPVRQSDGTTTAVPLSEFLNRNRDSVGALVLAGQYTNGRGPTTFLSHGFFAASGNMNHTYRRGVILLHEAVHQFGGAEDSQFGGSLELTERIVEKCAPALEGQLGDIVR